MSAPTTGCMLGWVDQHGYTGTNGAKAMETVLNTKFAAYRVYEQWNNFSNGVTAQRDDGKLVLVSHKPPKVSNAWNAIGYATTYDSDITNMVTHYKGLYPNSGTHELIFIFHHEPHDDGTGAIKTNPYGGHHTPGLSYGTPDDFIQAFRKIADAFHNDAGTKNIKIGYCAVADTWVVGGPGAPGSNDSLYPGDQYVDVLCHDIYNFYQPDPVGSDATNNPATAPDPSWSPDTSKWKTPSQKYAGTVGVAQAQNKPLILGETGSQHGSAHTTPVETRETWFQQMATYIKTDPVASKYMLGFCYYHFDNFSGSGNWWRFAQGQFTEGKTAFQTYVVNDPFFLKSPIPVSLTKSAPPPNTSPSDVSQGGGIKATEGFGAVKVTFGPLPRTLALAGIGTTAGFGTASAIGTTPAGTIAVPGFDSALAFGSAGYMNLFPVVLDNLGGIFSPSDYSPPEESAGLDFGDVTVSISPPTPTIFSGPYEFQPPYVDDVPSVLDGPYPWPTGSVEYRFFAHMKSRARGRTLILLNSGSVVGPLDWPVQVVSQDNDVFSVFVEQGLGGQMYTDVARVFTGGHVYYITAAEAQLLDDAGFGAGITQKNWNEGGWNEGGYGG